jgi:hypothetical protein
MRKTRQKNVTTGGSLVYTCSGLDRLYRDGKCRARLLAVGEFHERETNIVPPQVRE